MGMVTLVQDHEQTSDENQYLKNRNQINNASIEDRDNKNCRCEIVHSSVDTAISVAGNGSFAGSSTQCSNIEDDSEDDETDIDEGDWVPDLPVPTVFQHQEVITTDGNVVLPNADVPNFGDVRVKNSTNVHLGNKTFYKGPVTIKQFVYTNPTSIQESDTVKSDNIQTSNANTFNLSTAKGNSSENNSILSQRLDNDWSNSECSEINTISYYRTKSADDRLIKRLWTWQCAAFLCILTLVVLVTVGVIANVYFIRNSTIPSTPIFPQIPDSGFGDKIKNVRFIERNEWGAQPPATDLVKMNLPVPYVIISHTVTEFCETQSECIFFVRNMQTYHIESRKWSDISYNFLVGGDGYVYVGRSWDYMGAHAFGFNNRSIGISFIGTFNTVVPPKSQLYAAQRIIELGVENGKIAPDYKLLGHRQVSRTLSPGNALYSVIQTWPHWSPTP